MSADEPTIPDDAEETIRRHDGVAHVAMSVDDRPHVAPVFYHYEDGSLYFVTGGRKLANVRENPRVAVGLYEKVGEHPEDVRQATVLGTATVIEEWAVVKEYGDRIHEEYYGTVSDEWPSGESTLVRVDVGSVSHRGG